MTHRRWALGLLGAMVMLACRVADDDDEPVVAPVRLAEGDGRVVVQLDSAERARIGLVETPLRAVVEQAVEAVVGEVVVEPERVAVVRAPIGGRLAGADGAPWPAWGELVEAGRELGRVGDALPLAAPLGGTVSRVLARPGEFVAADQPLLEVTDYSRPVVRAAWPGGIPDAPPPQVRVAPGPGGPWVAATLLGPSPEADPTTRKAALLYRAERAWAGARPGQGVVVQAPVAGGVRGVLVPAAATVQWEGLLWAFVARDDGRYERVRVPEGHPAPAGWVVAGGLAPGDRVVTVGAQQLLSEEFRSRVSVGDETGD